MVEQLLLGVLSPLVFRVAEQVFEVPKILLNDVPERTAVRVTTGRTAGGGADARILYGADR